MSVNVTGRGRARDRGYEPRLGCECGREPAPELGRASDRIGRRR